MLRVKKLFISLISVALAAMVALSVFAENSTKGVSEYTLSNSFSVELSSNRHTHPDGASNAENTLAQLSGFEKKLENGFLEVWFKESIASVRIKDKRSGYVWGSLEAEGHENLNETLTNMANSMLTLEYYDENGNESKLSLCDERISANYKWKSHEMICELYCEELGLGLTFKMTLDGTELEFGLVEGSVSESDVALIKSLYFVPFLGCVEQNEKNGYMFVPDGPGALIRYSKSASYTSPYQKKVYGTDYGIDASANNDEIMSQRSNDFTVEAPNVSYPVFGLVHGAEKNAIFAEITSGEEYAVIQAYPAGFTTDFNWITARFDYRQKYVQPTGQDGKGIETVQEKANSMVPKLSYSFLTGENADYSGMASVYRNRLTERGVLKSEREDSQIPLLVNLVGSDVEKGFLTSKTATFTTVNQAEEIISFINGFGIDNLSVVYSGWLKGGINGSDYGTALIEKKLGKWSDFENLGDKVKQNGGRFYLNLNPVTATEKQISPSKNAAVTQGKEFESIVRDNDDVLFNTEYILKPTDTANYVSKLLKKYSFDFCFEELGEKLYSDYSRNQTLSRTQTKKVFEKVAGLSGNSPYTRPNVYMWKYTDEYFDIPMVNSQYLYETDTVPFLQMVLKGSIDYYAPYANVGFYNQYSVLKMIEYGAYPSVMLMYEDNYSLYNTGLEDYFSLNYSSWGSVIDDIYTRISSALEKTEGAYITEHKALSEGLVAVTYSNGTVICVNYGSSDVDTEYGTVSANGFIVKDR